MTIKAILHDNKAFISIYERCVWDIMMAGIGYNKHNILIFNDIYKMFRIWIFRNENECCGKY